MALGEEVRVGYQISYAGYAYFVRHYDVIAGSYLGLGVVGTNMSKKSLQEKLNYMENSIAKNKLMNSFNSIYINLILNYYAEYSASSALSSFVENINYLMMPTIGTVGYEPEQRSFFGLNRGISKGGYYVNAYLNNVVQDKSGNKNRSILFAKKIGMHSSSLEHKILEQVFIEENSPETIAFSASRALEITLLQGNKLFTLTKDNQSKLMPKINLDSVAMMEINQALSSGKQVITHANLIQIPHYKGAGYVILDPETGAGAYKISGGKNGGALGDTSDEVMYTAIGFDIFEAIYDIYDAAKGLKLAKEVLEKIAKVFYGVSVFLDLLGAITTIADIINECGDSPVVSDAVNKIIGLTVLSIFICFILGVIAVIGGPVGGIIFAILSNMLSISINLTINEVSKKAKEECKK